MKYISIISGFFLLATTFFAWGFFTSGYKIFPWSLIVPIKDDLAAYFKGGETNKKTMLEKLANDAGLRPERMLVDFWQNDKRQYEALQIAGLKDRRSSPLVYIKDKNGLPSGYLLLWGCFDFKKNLYGGILLDEKGRFIHKWIPDETDLIEEVKNYNQSVAEGSRIKYKAPKGRFPHGLVVFPDGSLIFNDGDHGNGMQKIDYCSKTQWIKLGYFNHALSKQNMDSSIWTIDRDYILHKIDPETGKSLKVIKIQDIMRANPDTDVFGLRRDYVHGEWWEDRLHPNDIDPLPLRYEKFFPQFNAGDLLLSLRAINALIVVDPKSKKIKWWRIGPYSRQHDPDWQAEGVISVYNNHMRDKYEEFTAKGDKKYSNIMSIDPKNYESTILYDGANDDFYSNIRGKHQLLPQGYMLITSSMQGRVFIVNSEGETVFEVLNDFDQEKSLIFSEAVWLPEDFFDFDIAKNDCLPDEQITKNRNMDFKSLHFAVPRAELKETLQKLETLPLESELSFRDNAPLLYKGWSKPEKSFRWSEGKSASIYFRLPALNDDKQLEIGLNLHTLGRQRIKVILNDKPLKTLDLNLSTAKWITLDLPFKVINRSDINALRFEFLDAQTPESKDPRVLAIALSGLEFGIR